MENHLTTEKFTILFLMHITTLKSRQNGRYFVDDIFKCFFAPSFPINSIPTLVQTMAWRRPGDKPLSESVMFSLLTYICVTRPQGFNVVQMREHSENYHQFFTFLVVIAVGPIDCDVTWARDVIIVTSLLIFLIIVFRAQQLFACVFIIITAVVCHLSVGCLQSLLLNSCSSWQRRNFKFLY